MSNLCSVLAKAHFEHLDAITLIHLPNGPTAYFKLTSIELSKRISVRPFKPSFVGFDC